MYNSTFLIEKWSISRGRETYGYNICTITDRKSGAVGKCKGGGYDMAGTSLAECLEGMGLNDHLYGYLTRGTTNYVYDQTMPEVVGENAQFSINQGSINYGTTWNVDKKGLISVTVDGATGYSNVIDIYKRAGVDITPSYTKSRNPKRLGWFVSWED